MKEIQLTKGLVAVVDDEDFERINRYKWYSLITHNCRYAARKDGSTKGGAKQRTYLMHREILGLTKGDGVKTDHEDGDGLNNRRYNIRRCTHLQNMANTGKRAHSGNPYKGIRLRDGKWQARISGEVIGRFTEAADAARAYDKEAVLRFGPFASLNFPK